MDCQREVECVGGARPCNPEGEAVCRVFIGFLLVVMCFGQGEAQEQEVAISGREVVERLTRIEEGQRSLEQRIDNVQTTLGQRIDDTNRRIDELRQFLFWGFGVTIAGMFALVGFVIWDRRSALAPAIRRIEELQEREERVEAALREYAAKSPELAESLKKMGLM